MKAYKKFIALVLCAVLALSLAGCGLMGKGKDVAGSWRTVRVETDNSTYKDARVNVELKTFGGCTLEVVYGDGREEDGDLQEGKWKNRDDGVLLKFDEVELELPINSDREMVYSDGLITAYMERMEDAATDDEEGSTLKDLLKRLIS